MQQKNSESTLVPVSLCEKRKLSRPMERELCEGMNDESVGVDGH